MIAAIRRVVNKPSLPVRSLPWFIFKVASPFSEKMRELYATRPLWQTPIELDNARLDQFLDKEPQTPIDTAMKSTLRGLGCLSK